MNRCEMFCDELFPVLYKVAYLITGDSSAASELAVNTVVQGAHHHLMKNLSDARISLMRILHALCLESRLLTSSLTGYGKLATLDYTDRCFVVFRHCSGLRFQDFCCITNLTVDQAQKQISKIAFSIMQPES